MTILTRKISLLTAIVLTLVLGAPQARAGGWSEPGVVLRDLRPVVSYRSKLAGEYLVVAVKHENGWHTNAMDNEVRALEKLAGKKSLGIDAPTRITVSEGLELAGPWYQTRPKDFSKPELRWFTWGFDGPALFVAKVQRRGEGPARVAVRGQACSETTCQEIDLVMSVPLSAGEDAEAGEIDFDSLVKVREADNPGSS